MLSSFLDMVRQSRPAGSPVEIDEAWKSDVLARMQELDMSRADLATMVGVTPSAITVLFRPATKSSRLVRKIQKALGMADMTGPAIAVQHDGTLRRMMRAWAGMSDEAREEIVRMGELLATKR